MEPGQQKPIGKPVSASVASFVYCGNPIVVTVLTMDSGQVWRILNDLRKGDDWSLIYSPDEAKGGAE